MQLYTNTRAHCGSKQRNATNALLVSVSTAQRREVRLVRHYLPVVIGGAPRARDALARRIVPVLEIGRAHV
jgi:hypothetical protein